MQKLKKFTIQSKNKIHKSNFTTEKNLKISRRYKKTINTNKNSTSRKPKPQNNKAHPTSRSPPNSASFFSTAPYITRTEQQREPQPRQQHTEIVVFDVPSKLLSDRRVVLSA